MFTHPIGLAIVQAGVSSPGDPLVVRQVAGSLSLVEEKALPQSGGVVVPGGNNRSKKQHHHAQHHRRSRHCPNQLSGRKRQCRWVEEDEGEEPVQERETGLRKTKGKMRWEVVFMGNVEGGV